MAKDVFSATNEQNNKINRSTYDWSHINNLTLKFGFIYPFLSWLVPSNTSLRMRIRAALQFMPMVFPAQTDMNVRVSLFKVPLRTLWKDFKDYIGNFRKNLEEPYLDLAQSFPRFMGTGKLADYLDIPTTISGRWKSRSVRLKSATNYLGWYISSSEGAAAPAYDNSIAVRSQLIEVNTDNINKIAPTASSLLWGFPLSNEGEFSSTQWLLDSVTPTALIINLDGMVDNMFDYMKQGTWSLNLIKATKGGQIIFSQELYAYAAFPTVDPATYSLPVDLDKSAPFSMDTSVANQEGIYYLVVKFELTSPPQSSQVLNTYKNAVVATSVSEYVSVYSTAASEISDETVTSEIDRYSSPYYDSSVGDDANSGRLKLAAYRARAYEAIYNAYLRDNRNNPYYVNGEVQYNVWIPTDEGGADKYPYELRRANWEKDFLTTAVPSPQQGRAPLVGLTTYETVDPDGVNIIKTAIVDETGKRYAVNYETDENGLKSVSYAEIDGQQGLQGLSFRQLVDAASTGISIPDLRAVNAYQKFLELNMRKGFSYKEIIEGRFDCQVRYDDLNIPEFLGGYTRKVTMNRVVQSVDRNTESGSYADALGSLAGDAFLSADDVPTISCFCDEESIIMGIISVVPRANYSQLLPKDYLYRDLLDHFQPEFNALGFQPITYGEVCPVQAYNAGVSLSTVYGYNRPWYEYVQKVDTVHGNFRTNLRNFLINRVFDAPPALTESFLLVDPNQVNDVFAVTEDTDKILGQVYIECECGNPVARIAIPRLD